MFTVQSKFFRIYNQGTANEFKSTEDWRDNGPFRTRESAEAFARNLATHRDIAQVRIIEEIAEEEDA